MNHIDGYGNGITSGKGLFFSTECEAAATGQNIVTFFHHRVIMLERGCARGQGDMGHAVLVTTTGCLADQFADNFTMWAVDRCYLFRICDVHCYNHVLMIRSSVPF